MGSSAYKNVRFLVLASDGLWDVLSTAEAHLLPELWRVCRIPPSMKHLLNGPEDVVSSFHPLLKHDETWRLGVEYELWIGLLWLWFNNA
jgi:hypothetical protein